MFDYVHQVLPFQFCYVAALATIIDKRNQPNSRDGRGELKKIKEKQSNEREETQNEKEKKKKRQEFTTKLGHGGFRAMAHVYTRDHDSYKVTTALILLHNEMKILFSENK